MGIVGGCQNGGRLGQPVRPGHQTNAATVPAATNPLATCFLDAVAECEGDIPAGAASEDARDPADTGMGSEECAAPSDAPPTAVPVQLTDLAGLLPADRGDRDFADSPGKMAATPDPVLFGKSLPAIGADDAAAMLAAGYSTETGSAPATQHPTQEAGRPDAPPFPAADQMRMANQGDQVLNMPAEIPAKALPAGMLVSPQPHPAIALGSGTGEKAEPAPDRTENQTIGASVVFAPALPDDARQMPPRAPVAEAARVVRQIAQRVMSSPDAVMEIILAPEELGKVRISIGQGESPPIVVFAERQETLDLLRRNTDILAREMRNAGLAGADISFAGGDGRGGQQGSVRTLRDAFAATVAPGEAARTAMPHPPRAPASGRQLDIRI